MKTSIRVAKVFGIPIEAHFTWVLIFILFTVVLSYQLGQTGFGWSAAQRWTVALLTVVLFFLSVLVHELSHSLVALRQGIPVRGITLYMFGGVSRLAHLPERPFTEFVVAIVGPASNVALAALYGGLWYLLGAGFSTLEMVLLLQALVNVNLAVFNLLPGYPLDGGLVLRAAIWRVTGRYRLATRISSWAGVAIGAIAVVAAVLVAMFIDILDGVWLALIGGFVAYVAFLSLRAKPATTEQRERQPRAESRTSLQWLKSHRIADVTLRHSRTMLPKELFFNSPLVAQGLQSEDDVIIVHSDGQPEGVVTRADYAMVAVDARPETQLAQFMAPISSFPSLAPEETIYDVVERMESEGSDRVFVSRAGVLLGYISRWDVMIHINTLRTTYDP